MPWAVSAPIGLACGVLLAAIAVPPGFLWSTEFGGYDALSYHLQLPKEWIAGSGMRPLPHAAYSGFPSFLEGAFMHLMAMRQDPRDAALACQALHAAMMVIAACMLGRVATRAAGSTVAGGATVAAALTTPWLLATGALPYSESGVMLGASLMLAAAQVSDGWRAGSLLGLGAAVAVGAKASSVILLLPGMAVAWFMLRPSPLDARTAVSATAVTAALLAPWLLRNAWFTGDPVFPLGGGATGGWWTAEQATRWAAAHRNDAGWLDRMHALWRQGPLFGWGPNPTPGEPWAPMWSLLPWTGVGAIAWLWRRDITRRWSWACLAMTAASAVAWMSGTHLQSRFLVPVAAPLSLATGLAVSDLATRGRSWRRTLAMSGVLSGMVAAWACLRDFDGSLRLGGQVALASGDTDLALLGGAEGAAAVAEVRARPSVEAAMGSLFPGQRIVAVGWSAPFWLRPSAPVQWSTVWDASVLEEALRQPDPRGWLQARCDLVLVDWPMLERWRRSGWLSPELDLDRLERMLQGTDAMMLAGGRRLHALGDRLRPTWPEVRTSPGADRSY